jgi:hypothetical protein
LSPDLNSGFCTANVHYTPHLQTDTVSSRKQYYED